MVPKIRAASLRGFASLVEELGGDPDRLLGRFALSRKLLTSDDELIPIDAHDLMLETAATELECPDLGLRLAAVQDVSVLGPLALAIQKSSTVAEALHCASRFLYVHSPALRVDVEPDPYGRRGVVALTYRKDLRESSYSRQGIELGLGLFFRIAELLIGGRIGLRSVEIPHRPLSSVRRYTDFFGSDVKFGRAVAAICVDRRILDERFAHADETIRQYAFQFLVENFSDPATDLPARVRSILAATLSAPPSLPEVARALAMHPRTLQRWLAAEDTTFDTVLDAIRRDTAHRLITTGNVPFSQVTGLVGFTEQATLSHAVRRWYGMSPRELRNTVETGLSR
ncbi:AraC family transcriptional regulator [Rhodococcus sp. HNM0563]|uniref:AraC family transcriptional regulator n=1 Tax=Rhodococcus sp. HNM0563 TaxID=2716339 RepID=UPI00146EEFE5|nr:AraC family transcriptional regulator [Rhodococcus sp. HNM0563]NLU63094.1 AraC family transcriptional regulator [Rhodococcus sp. HNM0563]